MNKVFCDFCDCEDCKTGQQDYLTHAETDDGKHICNICYRYSVCVHEKRKIGQLGGPCEDEHDKVYDCGHRPKIVSEWTRS